MKKKQTRKSERFGLPNTRGWFKFHYEKWLTGSVMLELEPDEQAVFVMFLCEAARSGRGGFEIHSRDLWARQHNIKRELLDRTIKKCLKYKKIEKVSYKRENFEFFWAPKWVHYQSKKKKENPENGGKKERGEKDGKDDAGFSDKIRLDDNRLDLDQTREDDAPQIEFKKLPFKAQNKIFKLKDEIKQQKKTLQQKDSKVPEDVILANIREMEKEIEETYEECS
ncbi:MAG: hypothetical protein HQ555_07750 [Candidatus Aminicenantes bacterium]|nr:hypothetical protein [Candidatus Aminicenantes bacterium]